MVTIYEQQYDFMPKKRTTDALFALRMLIEKYSKCQEELLCDRVPRENYVRVVQDMHEDSMTAVNSTARVTEEFQMEKDWPSLVWHGNGRVNG